MKPATLCIASVCVLACLGLCTHASADIMGVGPVDYQYHAAAEGGGWTEVADPGFGSPSWFTFPFGSDAWIAIPSQQQLDKATNVWLQVQWQAAPPVPPNSLLWIPQGFAATGGGNPQQYQQQNTYTYVWEWTITPQPGSEVIDIPATFPWSGVMGIDVAAQTVPEPSAIIGLTSAGLVGLATIWRRRKQRA